MSLGFQAFIDESHALVQIFWGGTPSNPMGRLCAVN
jgi:hypothetical protein